MRKRLLHPASIFLIGALSLRGNGEEQRFLPPGLNYENSGIVNMKTDAGAVGDGVTDDTAAFKEVFEAGKGNEGRFGESRFIYIPAGTYLIREPIEWGDKKKFIRGDGVDRTILRLADNSPGFQDPDDPQVWLNTKGNIHYAQNFLQRICDLTMDVGAGNPGVIALDYHTNNIGGMFNVRIRSSDPEKAGAVGLAFNMRPGPGLIWNVEIDGFDAGIQATGVIHSMTLAYMTLRNQRRVGIEVDRQSLFISEMEFEGNVPLLDMKNRAYVTLTNVNARSTNAQDTAIRVREDSVLLVRDLRVTGFRTAIEEEGSDSVTGPHVAGYVSGEARSLFPGGSIPNMPVKRPPIPDYEPTSEWAVVEATSEVSRDVQRAIDDGVRTVFIKPGPGGGQLKDTIVLRNNVERIIGFGTVLRSVGDWGDIDSPYYSPNIPKGRSSGYGRPVFRVEDGNAPVVILEFLHDEYGQAGYQVEHASQRPLIIMGMGGDYRNTVTGGEVFILDSVGRSYHAQRQRFWGWQVNTESYNWSPHVLNDGGMMWIGGHKIEKDRTKLTTINGGWTQLDGGFYYRNRERVGPAPAITAIDSTMSVGFRTYGRMYPVLVEETRNGETRTLTFEENNRGPELPLFQGVHPPSLQRFLQFLEQNP
ncbi:MAG: hypothetical protein JJU29_02355 [Verrucomicrobia bacterium]|nr:hypothetical protein [Verrucomicrobiota bacterium]